MSRTYWTRMKAVATAGKATGQAGPRQHLVVWCCCGSDLSSGASAMHIDFHSKVATDPPWRIRAAWASGCRKLIEIANNATAKAAARHSDFDLPPTVAKLRRRVSRDSGIMNVTSDDDGQNALLQVDGNTATGDAAARQDDVGRQRHPPGRAGLDCASSQARTADRSAMPGRIVLCPSAAISTVRGSSPDQAGSISKRSLS